MPNCIGSERTRLRMSQQDLADYLGVSRVTMRRYELDPKQTPYVLLEQMADKFDCSIDYLLGFTDERLPQKDEVA